MWPVPHPLPPALVLFPSRPLRPQAIKFIMKHGKSEKDIRALRQEIEILRSLQARACALLAALRVC